MLGFVCESVPEGELKSFLPFGYTILLKWKFDSRPAFIVFMLEDREMAFSEKFDLVAHIN